jgi:transcriptional regulator with XRE-family HTH domain
MWFASGRLVLWAWRAAWSGVGCTGVRLARILGVEAPSAGEGGAVAEPPVTFAGFVRKVRTEARLTQEDLAEASGVRPRSISDLERGVAVTPQRETIRRLADALKLTGLVRVQFEAIARGRPVPAGTEADGVGGAAAATRTLPRDIASFTGRQQELQELVTATSTAAQSGGVVSIHAIGGRSHTRRMRNSRPPPCSANL